MSTAAPPIPNPSISEVAPGPQHSFKPVKHGIGLIGVDVGSNSVKLAQVNKRGDTLELVATSCIDVAKATRHQTLGHAISAAVESGAFHSTDLACLLPKACYSEELLEGGAGPIASMHANIWAHLQRRGILRPEDVTIDYWPTESDSVPDRIPRCQIVAVRNRVVDDFVKDCQANGERLQCVDSIPFAALRTVELCNPSLVQQTAAVLDWGCSSARFTLTHQGTPVYSRELRGASLSAAAEVVAERFGISSGDALLLISHLPDNHSESGEFKARVRSEMAATLQPYCCNFVREISKTISYINAKLRVGELRQVILTGGGVVLSELIGLSKTSNQNVNTTGLSGTVGAALLESGIEVVPYTMPQLATHPLSATQLSLFANAISLSTLGWSAGQR